MGKTMNLLGESPSEAVSRKQRELARLKKRSKKLQEAASALRDENTLLAGELVDMHDLILFKLHGKAGICGHCGKQKCAGKLGNSQLPDTLSTQMVLDVLEEAFRTAQQVKDKKS